MLTDIHDEFARLLSSASLLEDFQQSSPGYVQALAFYLELLT